VGLGAGGAIHCCAGGQVFDRTAGQHAVGERWGRPQTIGIMPSSMGRMASTN